MKVQYGYWNNKNNWPHNTRPWDGYFFLQNKGVSMALIDMEPGQKSSVQRIERPIAQRVVLDSPERQARLDRLDILDGVVYICEDGSEVDPALENPGLAHCVLKQFMNDIE